MHDTVPHETVPHEHGPGSNDNLLLDIGAGTGALTISTTADRDQAAIEISPGSQARTHNVVRLRQTAGGPVYAAVFPALPAGDYVVWRNDGTEAGTVTVRGGQVASFRLD